MWINNKGLHLFGGKLKDAYTYTPPAISTEYFLGRKRSNFVLLDSSYEMGKLTLPIVFEGKNRKDVALKKSNFEKELFGRCAIGLPGEFSYFAFLESIGTPSFPSECMIETTYSLNWHPARMEADSGKQYGVLRKYVAKYRLHHQSNGLKRCGRVSGGNRNFFECKSRGTVGSGWNGQTDSGQWCSCGKPGGVDPIPVASSGRKSYRVSGRSDCGILSGIFLGGEENC